MAGFESYDQNGRLQFNTDMFTYALRYSGTVTAEARRIGNTAPYSVSMPFGLTGNYIVALGGGGGHGAGYAGLYSFGANDARRIYATNAPPGTVFTYYIFQSSASIAPTGFGLEVYAPNGQITFSSNQRTMRTLNIISQDSGAATYGGRTLAFGQGRWSGHRIAGPKSYYGGGSGPILVDPDAPPDGTYSSYRNDGKIYGGKVLDGGQTIAPEVLSFDDVTFGPAPDQPAPPDYVIPLKLFVVDVTGYPVGGVFF